MEWYSWSYISFKVVYFVVSQEMLTWQSWKFGLGGKKKKKLEWCRKNLPMAFDILTGEGGWIALGSNDHGDDGWEEKKKMEREDETVKSYLFIFGKRKGVEGRRG